ncbi:MAG: DUF2628 domain-containing protein [Rhodospirillales bacterium]|nr:DUF2628 domain-containing protein [Rhodospirillales bacterium]
MRIYTVFTPSIGQGSDPITGAVAVKEGFSWPAFLISPLWALWHRLWLAAILFAGAQIFLGWILGRFGADQPVMATASIGLAVLIGWTANDFRRAKLRRRGLGNETPVIAGSGEAAVRRLFEAQEANR